MAARDVDGVVQLLRGRGGYGSGRGSADINEGAERVEAAREEERLQRSGRVRIATVGTREEPVGRLGSIPPGKLAVAPSGIRLRAGKGLGAAR
jgi:hypothetical protein